MEVKVNMERSVGLSSFCIRKVVRLRNQLKSKQRSTSVSQSGLRSSGNVARDFGIENDHDDDVKKGIVVGRRIMVVRDLKYEAKAALQWALSHAVHSDDTLILVGTMKPFSSGVVSQRKSLRSYRMLHSIKNMCCEMRPEIKVETMLIERKDRGPAIVEEAERQRVSVLVIEQRKRSLALRLLFRLTGNWVRRINNVVDYCIQNANCITVAVQMKNRKGNGYLMTTKSHKDFWLLA